MPSVLRLFFLLVLSLALFVSHRDVEHRDDHCCVLFGLTCSFGLVACCPTQDQSRVGSVFACVDVSSAQPTSHGRRHPQLRLVDLQFVALSHFLGSSLPYLFCVELFTPSRVGLHGFRRLWVVSPPPQSCPGLCSAASCPRLLFVKRTKQEEKK